MSDEIPYPKLKSWMFERIEIQDFSKSEEMKYYKTFSYKIRVFDKIFNPLFSKLHLHSESFKWIGFKIIINVFKYIFRLFNRLEVIGLDNVPEKGIFIVNHPGSYDPIILQVAFKKPIGCFIFIEKINFFHTIEKEYGFIVREGNRNIQIEKMIRKILKSNCYFAIWPEGTLSQKAKVMQGFSGIIRAYATLNNKQNIIPFIPVLIQGSECYNLQFYPRVRKIKVKFLKPVYIERDWLKKPEQDGKTPREIIDYLMKILAKANGQGTFTENPVLKHVRRKYQKELEKIDKKMTSQSRIEKYF